MEIVRQLAERIMPPVCLLCGATADTRGVLCPDCREDLPRPGFCCPVCGIAQTSPHPCGRCLHRPPPYDCVITAYHYDKPVADLIRSFKYHGSLTAGRALTPALADRIRTQTDKLPQIMVPVPLHWRRLYRRGFNQSLEIARALMGRLGIKIETDLTRRRRATDEQARLSPRQRRRNIRKAFALQRRCDVESVAIIDDVITTGTTVAELARLLRRSGVKEIQVWALARASHKL